MDPEEAAAWAEMRAAFGELPDETVTSVSVTSVPSVKLQEVSQPAKTVCTGNADSWLQGEVDRLFGQLQRETGCPMADHVLRTIWRLSLDGQHDVLMGALATGTCSQHVASLIESREERAEKVWQLISKEVNARLASTQPENKDEVRRSSAGGQGVSGHRLTRPENGASMDAIGKSAPPRGNSLKATATALKVERLRSRSRSPSL